MAIFYHVSTDLHHSGSFIPRVPTCRHQDKEDDITKRVCVAPTVENCLTSIPNGGSGLENLNIDRNGYYRVFKIDTDKLGISQESIVNSDTLYKEDLVRDSFFSNEHWITTSFQVAKEDTFLIKLIDWEEEPIDVIPHSVIELADANEEYEGDYLAYYMDHIDEFVPCSVEILDANYIHEDIEKNMEIKIECDEDIQEELFLFIKENYDTKILRVEDDMLIFMFSKETNISEFFLFHDSFSVFLYDE